MPSTEPTKPKIGDSLTCPAADVASHKREIAANLPKGAALSVVTKGALSTITVVKA